ncbi:hydroxymethylpyrimidine/phosphomethylpyrimidine kinase family protein [Allosediminivita pacifica]|uniref:hydroxymethylpyrimidine kinase n=1 Tax=Allosediminivita pacifica TaxID=1267769 RepID=A0A2T6AC49_9RHOB|nr:bifunctional hydroxymethylpyrimidine kinase/phosphomethylpyrimidine kinase [Allosediminivita pacifica]PTX41374.1 hydroxymethylpyrimidine/phosphomethylpyrimidine kinase [Allosediminivita pacifica]GGB23508.1 hydroxymethylpyrimidine/phosphomethylpyrimidine kinase [Allosediminivita pacifica]
MPTPSALTIAGSDSGGGSGIQADLKTFSALGVYGTSAITAATAQNTRGVFAVEAVAAALTDYDGRVLLDPVMVAKSGDVLLAKAAEAALIERLLPRADVLTPNLPEAVRLLGRAPATTAEETAAQDRALLDLGARSVVMKSGHAEGAPCIDRLVTASGVAALEQPRRATRNTHGTGCSLSSAIVAELAKGAGVEAAIRRAQAWLHGAIRAAEGLGIGGGHGPVHHFQEVGK